ncbi:MAG: fumarylacetoacetate hydrolase family protein [Chloroflexi bacterium]|nr:fumarylacetoacetate hydrolase family protein [Chloroflexota bacterium]
MRLVTFDDGAGQRIGAVLGEQILDLSAAADVPSDTIDFLAAGEPAWARARAAVERAEVEAGGLLERRRVRLLAPIPRPRKNVFALGLNYSEHVAEGARARGVEVKLPRYPVFFTKTVTAVIGPEDAIPFDGRLSDAWDWEAELAVVIGKGGKDIPRARALEHVFGYTCLNDVSVRDVQRQHGGQFLKGKSIDGSCPLGPWIVTRDEVPDVQNLRILTRVNGETKQDSNTRHMIFDVATTIESLSAGMTLEPGDIIATGTPDGVGFARTPPEALKPGDVVEVEVEGVGVLRNAVVDRWA